MNQTRSIQKLLGIVSVSILTSIQAWAGVSTSGGGFAVVTRDTSGKIQKAELLDLYEARENLGFTLSPSTGSMEQDYTSGIRNTVRLQWWPIRSETISEERIQFFANNTKEFLKRARFTRSGEKLPYQNDIGSVVNLPEGTELEQLAVFDDHTGMIAVDSEIWMNLDSLSQAALVEHEFFYHEHRKYHKGTTSKLARLWVAHVYADQKVPAVDAGISKDAVFCTENRRAVDTRFYIYPKTDSKTGKNQVVFQFMQLAGYALPTKAQIEISSLPPVGKGIRRPVQSTYNPGWEVGLVRTSDVDFNVEVYEEGRLISSYPVTCRR